MAPRKRSGFVEVARGLAQKEIANDTAAARRCYLVHLEGVARERGGVPAMPQGETRTLQSTLRRGWYFGAEEFRDKLLDKLAKLKGKDGVGHRRRSGYNGAQARDHGEAEAQRLLKAGLAAAGLRSNHLPDLKKRDWRKRVVGRLIRKRTVMPVAWIAESLCLGHPNGAATLIRSDPKNSAWGAEWKQAKKLLRRLEEA